MTKHKVLNDNVQKLNLPHTDFAMKADLAKREPHLLKEWDAIHLDEQLLAKKDKENTYILHDGPPYANGPIHLGHAVNKILKDIICKSQRLEGKYVPYVPGWDCHGLPIEINVEKKIGKAGDKVSAKEFRGACRLYAQSQIELQREAFKRLGILGDWTNPYLTMDFHYEADTIRALKILIERGYLNAGFKPVHWCFSCQSSLAEGELEYEDKISPSIDVKFNIKNEADFLKLFSEKKSEKNLGYGDISIIIWTTTPWTLPANYAVAVHPELKYALIQVNNERFVIAEELVEKNMKRYGIAEYKILASILGKHLNNLILTHPLFERDSILILGEHVTLDAGTGAVHTAPAHGQEDFEVGKIYDLPILSPVQNNGVFASDTPFVGGEFVFKANTHIIEILREKNKLLCATEIKHAYPHCWRHKTPVVYRATPQWFLKTELLDKKALGVLGNIHWKPNWGKERMEKMLKRPEWCISRQRTWGVPIPLFIHKKTQEKHPNSPALMEKVAKRVEAQGIDAWFDLSIDEFLGHEANEYEKVIDVLDVWFESGISHYAVLAKREGLHFPADVYLEGSDQYRGWFQSALLTSVGMNEKTPYKNLITHGFTVDEQGRKMSKSLGNVIAPEEIIKTYGADVLRLWVASSDYTTELSLSNEILKRTSEMYRRIRNTARFLLSNLYDFDFEKDKIKWDEMLKLDQYVLGTISEKQNLIKKNYREFNFHQVVQEIHHTCSITLGTFYLDILKDRLYTSKKEGLPRRSAQTVLYHILKSLVCWISPILSFTADEIYKEIKNKAEISIHLEQWHQMDSDFNYSEQKIFPLADYLIHLRNQVNKEIEQARNEGKIGSGLEAVVSIFVNDEKDLAQFSNELKFLFIVSEVIIKKGEFKIIVDKIIDEKCPRCWHRSPEIPKENLDNKVYCKRCESNVNGEGEKREFF